MFSFCKEELRGETTNMLSFLAKCRQQPKDTVLQDLVEAAIDAHPRALHILQPHKEVHEAYRQFSEGYAVMHIATPRYRLTELELDSIYV